MGVVPKPRVDSSTVGSDCFGPTACALARGGIGCAREEQLLAYRGRSQALLGTRGWSLLPTSARRIIQYHSISFNCCSPPQLKSIVPLAVIHVLGNVLTNVSLGKVRGRCVCGGGVKGARERGAGEWW
jgi:hypothetical protein